MKKPRSQHARFLQELEQSRFEIWWCKRRLREIAEDRARAPHKFDWDIIETSYQESLIVARLWHAENRKRARAIRLAMGTRSDPLFLGTLHPFDPYWLNPPGPSRAGAATTSPR